MFEIPALRTRSKAAIAVACLFAMLSFPAAARIVQNRTQLEPADVLAMPGKSLAITVREPPPHFRMDTGDVWAGAIASGLSGYLVERRGEIKNEAMLDPGAIARDLVIEALRDQRGLQPQPIDTTQSDSSRPKALADAHTGADYVLDVKTLRRKHMEFKGHVGVVFAWIEFQLVNVSTRHTDAWMRCDFNTALDPDLPQFDALEAEDGRLLRHALTVLAARCARKFATERLRISRDKLSAMSIADSDPSVLPAD